MIFQGAFSAGCSDKENHCTPAIGGGVDGNRILYDEVITNLNGCYDTRNNPLATFTANIGGIYHFEWTQFSTTSQSNTETSHLVVV